MFVAALHSNPEPVLQAAVPHLQGAVFKTVLSMLLQIGPAQKLDAELQYLPLKEVHAAAPHLQSMLLRRDPSTFEQAIPELHVLVDAMQKSPVVAVQVEVPQKQRALLLVVPSVWVQTGAAMQMQ